MPKSVYTPVNGSNYIEALSLSHFEITDYGEILSQSQYIITSNQKEELKNSLLSLMKTRRSNEILKLALRSSIKMRRLSDEYTCLLQDKISDEDFETIASEYKKISIPYAFEARSLPAHEIAVEAKVILDAAGEELGSDEIADILELDVTDVENALREYSS